MIECHRGSAKELYVHTYEARSGRGLLSVVIVSRADYKTRVWRFFGLGRPWLRPALVSGCERQEVKGMSGAEPQDV